MNTDMVKTDYEDTFIAENKRLHRKQATNRSNTVEKQALLKMQIVPQRKSKSFEIFFFFENTAISCP